MKKVVILAAEGFEEIEALAVADVLRRAKLTCDICTFDAEMVTGAHGIRIKGDRLFESTDFDCYDGIVLPGGMPGTENLRKNSSVLEVVKKFYSSGRMVAAICAAPTVLSEADILEGKKITSYPHYEKDFKKSIYTENKVEIDGNILTSRGPATAILFGLSILKYLGYASEAENIKKAMLITDIV